MVTTLRWVGFLLGRSRESGGAAALGVQGGDAVGLDLEEVEENSLTELGCPGWPLLASRVRWGGGGWNCQLFTLDFPL